MLAESQLRERLAKLPGIERLRPALHGLPASFLVGGAVRDLLLDVPIVDLDVAIEGDAEAVAAELARRLSGSARLHGRFGTATVEADGLHVDLATVRRETYSEPGALPDVEPAPSIVDDLGRRDFTINALALGLAGDAAGDIRDPHGGRADLQAGLVRVLHPRSFVDDPTRLLRAVRYAARFGFSLDPETDRLAREATATGALGTVSGPRIRDELMDLLAEHEAPRAVELLRALGLDRALHPALGANAELVASAKLGAAETGADPSLTALAALCVDAPDELEPWIERLAIGASERDAVLAASRSAPLLPERLRYDLRPSQLYALLAPEPPEALALALALGARAEPVLDFQSRLRGTRLEITGDDVVAAGVPESPAVGRALQGVLARKLDGELAGRAEELAAALEIARAGA